MITKILVCGNAGFLLSNFIRYVLYRTRDYKFVGIDNLSTGSIKNVYTYRHTEYTKFCLGDINDNEFINNLIKLEHPDIIINGTKPKRSFPDQIVFDHKKILDGVVNLSQHNIPIIQLGWPQDIDTHGIWNLIKNIIIKETNGTYLSIPNCFGMRQKGYFQKEIKGLIIDNKANIYKNNDRLPWVYAEDVASFLWFIIENRIKGNVEVPAMFYSINDMISFTISLLSSVPETSEYIEYMWEPLVLNYIGNNDYNWKPDCEDVTELVKKTVLWYNANRWALT